ncbi:MAG: NTP transferase domain-containing protein [Armatimonadetes bacterium]|nr:NTP transferase domain-containing protein [Armatimonadota bacterium]
MIAVVPAAGLGTRMAEITGGEPKELLPLGGVTVIEHVLNEVLAVADRAIVVVSPAKRSVMDRLENMGHIEFALQLTPAGFADALACAGKQDEDVLIAVPDVVLRGQLISRLAESSAGAAVAYRNIQPEHRHRYGILEMDENHRVARIIEKPMEGQTESCCAIAGRWFLSRALWNRFIDWAVSHGSQSVTDFLASRVELGEQVQSCPLLEGEDLFDCGSVDGYRAAVEALGP